MKKRYTTPEVETIYLNMEPVMTNASITGGFEDDVIIDSDDQGAGSHRSDWDNIWDGM